MVAAGSTDRQPVGRCSHCGRPVQETRHTPTGYRVDYYSLRTGDVEPATLTTDAGLKVNFFKLLSTVDIITCADCYRLTAVQDEREERFHPERQLPIVEADSRE
jgi:hypothetical protein